jgi:hypothetical protein
MSVRDRIRATLAATPSGTPLDTIATNLLASIPKRERQAAIKEMATIAIRVTMRRDDLDLAPPPATTERHLAPVHTNGQAATAKPGRSKWELGVPAWRRMLNRSYMVNGAPTRLGNLTAPQLREQARVRRVQAGTMVRHAEWQEKVAAALDEHKVRRVEDLPERALCPLLEAEDAAA